MSHNYTFVLSDNWQMYLEQTLSVFYYQSPILKGTSAGQYVTPFEICELIILLLNKIIFHLHILIILLLLIKDRSHIVS